MINKKEGITIDFETKLHIIESKWIWKKSKGGFE